MLSQLLNALNQLQQAAPASPQGATGDLLRMLPWIFIPLIFYFVVFAPERKRQKQLKEQLASMKKGDKVITTGGIYGTIAQVEDSVVWVKIADTPDGKGFIKVKMAKTAITAVLGDSESGSKDAAA